ncbi:hypothetical protein LWI29_027876 [Acer saccharum]|uniref:Translation initiation factor eIF2B subunit beta n=1 Tax=Acer saccharum TaxID=4024 RepID=A0AA39W8V5_ACESA|nr:hypothetical protein LWI29_027876 [Acer saccharum]
MPDIQVLVNDFVSKLRKRKIEGSDATARLTAELLRSVISQQPTTSGGAALIEAVKSAGEQLIAANPVELAVGNIVRQVLHIIRKEDFSLVTNAVVGLKLSAEANDEEIFKEENEQNPSTAAVDGRCLLRAPLLHALHDQLPYSATACQISALGDSSEGKAAEKIARSWKLKHDVIKAVNELIEDLNTCHEPIAEQAVELIHHKHDSVTPKCILTLLLIVFSEVILTLGRSRFVLEFLKAAKEKKRSFHVFIAEGAPRYQGHVLAKELSAKGLKTTVITDSAVFAMISRVNMVVLGVHAVMANGGVIAPVGSNMVALAAKKHAVPLVVVAGVHELCSLFPQNPELSLNEIGSPSELLNFGEFSDCMDYGIGCGSPLLHVVNPVFDYVPPELVSLFVTDAGAYNPSYIYQLIADYYSPDDLTPQKPAS